MELSGKTDPYLNTTFARREVEQKDVGGGLEVSTGQRQPRETARVLTDGQPVVQCGPTQFIVGAAHSPFVLNIRCAS